MYIVNIVYAHCTTQKCLVLLYLVYRISNKQDTRQQEVHSDHSSMQFADIDFGEISQWNSDNDIPTLLSRFTVLRTRREMTQPLASK